MYHQVKLFSWEKQRDWYDSYVLHFDQKFRRNFWMRKYQSESAQYTNKDSQLATEIIEEGVKIHSKVIIKT